MTTHSRWRAAAAVAVALALAGCGGAAGDAEPEPAEPEPAAEPTEPDLTAIEEVRKSYLDLLGKKGRQRVRRYADIRDEGRTLVLDGASEGGGDGLKIEDLGTMLYGLGIPDSVIARMESTRAMDGMQDADWDGFEASWTFHPDEGLDVIVTES